LLQLLDALRAYVGSLPKDCERTLYLERKQPVL